MPDCESNHNHLLHCCLHEIRKTINPVWQYFGFYPTVVSDKNYIVVCKICHEKYKEDMSVKPNKWEVTYSASRSTSKLATHLQSRHRKVYQDLSREEIGDSTSGTKHPFFKSCKETVLKNQREKYLRWVVESIKTSR